VQSDETLITAYFPIPKATDLYQERAKKKFDTKLAKIPKSIIYFGQKDMLEQVKRDTPKELYNRTCFVEMKIEQTPYYKAWGDEI